MNLPIRDNGERKSTGPGVCYYCGAKGDLNAEGIHKADCVVPDKAVVVQRTMTFIIDVPRYQTKESIEFSRNESSSCANNDIRRLVEMSDMDNDDPERSRCTCLHSHTEVLRDADAGDLAKLPRTFPYKAQE